MNRLKILLSLFWPGMAILLGIAVVYLTYSRFERRMGLNITRENRAIAEIENDLSRSQEIMNQIHRLRNEMEPYLPFLYPTSSPDSLIDDIKRAASAREVRVADIWLDVPKLIMIRETRETISLVPFEMSFVGDFFSLGGLLEDLEKKPYLHDLAEMEMAIQVDSGQKIRLSVRGVLSFFRQETIAELVSDGA